MEAFFNNIRNVSMDTFNTIQVATVEKFNDIRNLTMDEAFLYDIRNVSMDKFNTIQDATVDKFNNIRNLTIDELQSNGTWIWDRCDANKITHYVDPVAEAFKFAALIVGLALLIFVVGFVLLGIVGFADGGVLAGSWAAAWQSVIGNVVGGSCFAILQSCGAGFCNVYGCIIILILTSLFSLFLIYTMCA